MTEAHVNLEALPDTRGQCDVCMESLRRRVCMATTGTGYPAIVLAVSAALSGVDVDFAADLFEVDEADLESALMEVQ